MSSWRAREPTAQSWTTSWLCGKPHGGRSAARNEVAFVVSCPSPPALPPCPYLKALSRSSCLIRKASWFITARACRPSHSCAARSAHSRRRLGAPVRHDVFARRAYKDFFRGDRSVTGNRHPTFPAVSSLFCGAKGLNRGGCLSRSCPRGIDLGMPAVLCFTP